MFCSTIIPTIGRPAVDRAVQSVLAQQLVIEAAASPAADVEALPHGLEENNTTAAGFEVIVVNDSGQPLPDAPWHTDPRVRIIDTNRRERSVARNSGAALAKGEYLHFLDDDDWILPGTFTAFYRLAHSTDADWLYGRTQLIDRQEQPLIQLSHGIEGNGFLQTMAGEWIPLQSSLISSKAFFATGGFEPLISGPEDIDLLRRMALRGNLASMDTVVSCLGMGAEGSSTDTERHAERSRWARENILALPGVFVRLRQSASGAEWRGRWARIYLTSAIWNGKKGKLFGALSRSCYGVAALLWSAANMGDAAFWRGLRSPYESKTFSDGEIAAAEQANALQTEASPT